MSLTNDSVSASEEVLVDVAENDDEVGYYNPVIHKLINVDSDKIFSSVELRAHNNNLMVDVIVDDSDSSSLLSLLSSASVSPFLLHFNKCTLFAAATESAVNIGVLSSLLSVSLCDRSYLRDISKKAAYL